MNRYDAIADRVAPFGLIMRGGFHPVPADGLDAKTVVMIGNAGTDLWPIFSRDAPESPHPLDTWVRACMAPIAETFGADLVMPSDGPPYHPFQRWAMRSDPVHRSPLGLLIHPEFGLWHAYRAALLLRRRIDLPPRPDTPSPCASCIDRPCLTACPVEAFTTDGFLAADCRTHVAGATGAPCRAGGCRSRLACPIGRPYAYDPAQQAFHMASFLNPPRTE